MYYPLSQIITNLKTNGGEYVLSLSGEEYSGSYYATSDGNFFTGLNPNNKPNFKLSPINSDLDDPSPTLFHEQPPDDYYFLNTNYWYARGVDVRTLGSPAPLPIYTPPQPTEEDYQNGEMQRYFLKKVNEISYLEVNSTTFTNYVKQSSTTNYSLYNAFSIPWVLTGKREEAYQINKNTVSRTEKMNSLRGFKSYLKNRFDQLFKYSKGENLYTEGKEFRLSKTGKFYQGYYHIHPEKGPMEGRQHTPFPHDFLIPVSGSSIDIEYNNIETQSSNRRGGGY